MTKIDHVALEVPDIDAFIATFVSTGGLKLIREGTVTGSGRRMAMLGDRAGVKIELIENPDCQAVGFLHVAFASDNMSGAVEDARRGGWDLARGPFDIAAAKAKSAFLTKDSVEVQVLHYQPDSPDLQTW